MPLHLHRQTTDMSRDILSTPHFGISVSLRASYSSTPLMKYRPRIVGTGEIFLDAAIVFLCSFLPQVIQNLAVAQNPLGFATVEFGETRAANLHTYLASGAEILQLRGSLAYQVTWGKTSSFAPAAPGLAIYCEVAIQEFKSVSSAIHFHSKH